MNLKSVLTRLINKVNIHDSLCASYLASSQTVSTSLSIVNCSGPYTLTRGFSRTSDGGIKCLFDGVVKVSGMVFFGSLTANDRVMLNVGRWHNSAWEPSSVRPTIYANGAGTTTYLALPETPVEVTVNDNIYLRAGNSTASRGSITNAYIIVERIG